MTEDSKTSPVQEFKLDPDHELRFEVESKKEKVVLEVSINILLLFIAFNCVTN